MNFPTDLLSIFSRHNGTQSPDDALVDVPSIITPTLEIPEITVFTPFLVTSSDLRQTSFIVTQALSVANAAAVDTVICVLAPGLWDLTILSEYFSNYTNIDDFGEVYFTDSTGALGASIWTAVARVAGADRINFKLRIAHKLDSGLFIRGALEANGVGEEHNLDTNVFASRLG